MRLSDAGFSRRQAKLIYPNHQLPPWLTEDAPRDRSNRLLDDDYHACSRRQAVMADASHATALDSGACEPNSISRFGVVSTDRNAASRMVRHVRLQ